jgi:hypothetical protein
MQPECAKVSDLEYGKIKVQRVFNILYSARLSRRRTIWLRHPLSLQQIVILLSLPMCRPSSLL